MSTLVRANIKASAKKLKEILKEQYEKDIKLGHALEIMSQALGSRDWNTLSAMSDKSDLVTKPIENFSEGYATKEAAIAFLTQTQDVSIVVHRPYEIDISWGPDDPDGGGAGAHFERGVDETSELSYRIENDRLIIEVPQETNVEYVDEHWKRTVEREEDYPQIELPKIEKSSPGITEEESREHTVEEFINIIREMHGGGYLVSYTDGKLTLRYDREFILKSEIESYRHSDRSDMANYYGVVLQKTESGGYSIDKSESHNVEGFIEELKQGFREAIEQEIFAETLNWGFSNQISKWTDSNFLSISASLKVSENNLEGLKKLINEKIEEAGGRYISHYIDLKRGK
jgi:hypothetical protein